MQWFFDGGFLPVGVVGFPVALFAMAMLVRLFPYRSGPEREPGQEFSEKRYAPMVRMLAAEDFDFVASHPGYRVAIASKLRRSRRRVFRLYLRELAKDFHGLHALARQMAAVSGEERAGLVDGLIRQELAFWRTMIAIEFRMMTPGLAPGIEVRALVMGLEAMRAELSGWRLGIGAWRGSELGSS
jgi:hypothetical protein